jgi:hypothetical protein
MSLNVKTGLVDSGGKSVLIAPELLSDEVEEKGRLYIFLAPGEVEIKPDKIAASIKSRYYKSNHKAFKALENVVKAVNDSLIGLGAEIGIAAIAIEGDNIYCACVGEVQVSISRGTSFATILQSTKSVITAKGRSKEGDTIILFSRKAKGAVSAGRLQEILAGDDINKLETKLREEIENSDGSIGLVYFLKKSGKGFKGLYGRINGGNATEEVIPDEPVSYQKRSIGVGLWSRFRIRRRSPSPQTRRETRNKKVTMTIGVILLVLLLLSMSFGIFQKNRRDALEKFEPELLRAIEDLESAIELSDISPSRAMENFVSAKSSAEKLKGEGVEDERLTKLLQDIDSSEGKVLGTYKATPQVFLDLPLLSDPFEGDDLFLTEQTLYVLDRDNRKIASVELDSKRSEIVAGPSVVEDEDEVLGYSGTVYTSAGNGINMIESERESVIEKDWKGEFLSSAYAGNIYVLAKGESTIYRFPAIESGFAGKQNWLKEGLEPDFSDIVSWAIDGSMWLLSGGGKIYKYGLGIQQNYNLGSVPTSLSGATQIYTDEDSEHIYLLIPDQKQILVVDKGGEYQALYESDEIQFARDLAVSEAERKIIILTGDKLHEIEARHLGE